MRALALIAVAALTACGVDGAPERPEKGEPAGPFNVSVTGTAEVGITGGSN